MDTKHTRNIMQGQKIWPNARVKTGHDEQYQSSRQEKKKSKGVVRSARVVKGRLRTGITLLSATTAFFQIHSSSSSEYSLVNFSLQIGHGAEASVGSVGATIHCCMSAARSILAVAAGASVG